MQEFVQNNEHKRNKQMCCLHLQSREIIEPERGHRIIM